MDNVKHQHAVTTGSLPSKTTARYEAKVGRKRPTRDEVKARLDSKSADITARLATIQDNVIGGGEKAKKIVESPLLPVAGSLLAGLAVGLLFGGSGKSRDRGVELSPDISDLLVRKVNEANAKGIDPTQAVQQTINRFASSKPRKSNKIVTAVGGLLLNLAMKQAVSYFEGRSIEAEETNSPSGE